MILPDFIDAPPVVYAVGKEYQIFVQVKHECLMWVKVGSEEYYDDSNGILRSASMTHKMIVPMEELDQAKKYTICYRLIGERLPYFSKTGPVEELTFEFRPIPADGENLRMYMISDTHNRVNAPVEAGKFFGDKLDLLILNGDIPDHSGDIKNFGAFHRIAGRVSNGNIPVVLARGNHDLRGICAEQLANYTPTDNGKSYYTVRLGSLWFLMMDCGEDKDDSHEAYGFTNCCSAFRKRETKFLERVIRNAAEEYAADGVKYKFVVCHVPFTDIQKPPFDIEQELYGYWCKLLRESVKPNLMLCGHMHDCYVSHIGSAYDKQGQACPVIVGGKPGPKSQEQMGTALELDGIKAHIMFTDQDRRIHGEETLEIK